MNLNFRSSLRGAGYAAFAGILCSLWLVASPAAKASDLTIRMAWYMPPHTAVAEQGNEIAQNIKSMSHGAITVQTYPSGSLLNESSIGQGIANNTANMGIWGMHWWSNKAPALEWDTIPFLVTDAHSLLKALHGKLGDDVNKILNHLGVEVIGWGFYGYAKSYVNTKHPIKRPSDLKGLKMRSEGRLSSHFLKSQGATPVAMDSSEVYTAMQRGALNGATSGLSSIISRKWYEVGKYITAIHYVPLVYPVQVNRSWWQGLTAKQRQTISKAVAATEGDDVSRIEKEFNHDIKLAKQHGDQVYRPSKADLKQWKQATRPLAEKNYLQHTGKQGQQILNDVKAAKSGG
jgi:TRAP-type C4-dicarboxylate transport system substrate-binding protein